MRSQETVTRLAALLRTAGRLTGDLETEVEAEQLAAELEAERAELADPNRPRRPQTVAIWQGRRS